MRFGAVVVGAMAFLATQAAGQVPPPLSGGGPRPPYSPYLNLTRPGGGPAQNYYGLVRPEVETRNNVFQLRRDTQAIAFGLATPAAQAPELETGHATGYMTHLRYYGTNGSGRVAAATAAAPRLQTYTSPAPVRRR